MMQNKHTIISNTKNITYVIFIIFSIFFIISCKSLEPQENNAIILESIQADTPNEVNISFDDDTLSYEVVNDSSEITDVIGERKNIIQPTIENETVRFVYLDENGNEIRQKIEKILDAELLDSQFNSNIESINSKRDFYNSIVEYTYKDGKLYEVIVNNTSVTDIRLEGNETISGNLAIGDSENYSIETTTSVENGKEILHLLIRSEENFGETILLIPTNKRTYYFRLIATNGRAMVGVRFKYNAKSDILLNSQKTTKGISHSTSMYDIDALTLFFGYRIESNSEIVPQSVFSNDKATFFQFDPRFVDLNGAPSLYLKKNNKLELINYSIKGNLYVTPTLLSNNESFVFLDGEEKTEIFKENV